MSRARCERALAAVFLEDREIAGEADFIWEALGLARGSRVLDQGCGTGRLSLELAARGALVVGVDRCAGYIREARSRVRGLSCQFYRADAARFQPSAAVDGVLNWFSSFGYGSDGLVLRRAFAALKPGGSLLLDCPLRAAVLADFQPVRVWKRGEVELRRDCSWERPGETVRVAWASRDREGEGALSYKVRLYRPERLAAMAAARGFERIRFLGGERSRRCVLLARRPA